MPRSGSALLACLIFWNVPPACVALGDNLSSSKNDATNPSADITLDAADVTADTNPMGSSLKLRPKIATNAPIATSSKTVAGTSGNAIQDAPTNADTTPLPAQLTDTSSNPAQNSSSNAASPTLSAQVTDTAGSPAQDSSSNSSLPANVGTPGDTASNAPSDSTAGSADDSSSVPPSTPRFQQHFSGYLKTVDFLTQTTGASPVLLYDPFYPIPRGQNVFNSLERLRLRSTSALKLTDTQRLSLHIEYDNQPQFGNYVSTGDFDLIQRQIQQRQFLNQVWTLAQARHAVIYQQLLYRAILSYETKRLKIDTGRQLITWGNGVFFTPMQNLFNPFYPTQIEWFDRRPGVDAVHASTARIGGVKLETVYTPPKNQLAPQRLYARASRDILGMETCVMTGHIFGQETDWGLETARNIGKAVARGEFLFRYQEHAASFAQIVFNMDYNFPKNIHGILEYYYNGQGNTNPKNYQLLQFINGTVQQLGQQYIAAYLGKDLTPLLRFDTRVIMNLNDRSTFIRPEFQYQLKPNLLLTVGVQLFNGSSRSEYGFGKNTYFTECKYSF